ncbi:hypothetical protein V8B97DRAFT_2023804 [Scleroderma yunnanense]
MAQLASVFRNPLETSSKACPTGHDVIVYILPVFAVQYLMGVLVQFKNTAYLRIALFPIMPWIALRALLALDLSCGQLERAQSNAIFFTHLISVTARVTIWALARQPYKRDNVREAESTSIPMALWNAWDLLLSLRGIGWNWSQGVPVPKPSAETRSRVRFLLFAAARVVFFGLAFDAFTEAIRAFFQNTSPLNGDTIFNQSLLPITRYLQAFGMAYLTVWMAYFAMQWAYYFLAIFCVIVFYQHPSQWPPLFDSPWLSTSLSELWGRRWHQMLRYAFFSVGGVPLSYVFGHVGLVLGTFLLSGLFHDIEIRAVGRGGNSLIEVGFFVMNGVGILLERAWAKAKGRRVRGIYGWVWTFSWLAIWGIPVVDLWAKSGRFGFDTFPAGFKPAMSLLSLVLPSGVHKGFAVNCLCFGISLPFLVYTTLFTLPA